MRLKRKSRLGFFLRVFLPPVLGFLILLGGVNYYVFNFLTHPQKRQFDQNALAQWAVVRPIYWENVSWTNKETEFNGWVLVYGAGAPGIVLTHGYGGTRQDLLDLGYRLWERGYNILLCDLRGHGENKRSSTLGSLEKDDLSAAVKYFKNLKLSNNGQNIGKLNSANGTTLVDPQNIGLFGVDIGAYASLMVATEDDSIKAVVADTPFPSPLEYVYTRTEQVFNVRSSFINPLVNIGTNMFLKWKYNGGSIFDIVQRYSGKNKKVMVIIGGDKDSQVYRANVLAIYDRLPPSDRKLFTPASSRLSAIYKEAADEYNSSVCDFFKEELQALPASSLNKVVDKDKSLPITADPNKK